MLIYILHNFPSTLSNNLIKTYQKSISDNAALSANEREALLSEINSLKQEISELKTDMQENYINKNDLTFSVNGDDLTITKNY